MNQAALQLVYTVPAGRTLVVRLVNIVNASTSATATWRININSAAGASEMTPNASLAPSSRVALTDWFALNPGDQLWMRSDGAALRVTLFGALLLGAPT